MSVAGNHGGFGGGGFGGGGGGGPGGNDPFRNSKGGCGGDQPNVIKPESDSEEEDDILNEIRAEDDRARDLREIRATMNDAVVEHFNLEADVRGLEDQFGVFRGVVFGQMARFNNRLGRFNRHLGAVTLLLALNFVGDYAPPVIRSVLRWLGYDV